MSGEFLHSVVDPAIGPECEQSDAAAFTVGRFRTPGVLRRRMRMVADLNEGLADLNDRVADLNARLRLRSASVDSDRA